MTRRRAFRPTSRGRALSCSNGARVRTKALQQGAAALAAAFLVAAFTPAIGVCGDISYTDGKLEVPITENRAFRNNKLGIRHTYSLYRLLSADAATPRNAGIVVLKRGRIRGLQAAFNATSVTVERRPIARAQIDDGRLVFDLPVDERLAIGCYAVVDVQSVVRPLRGHSDLDAKYSFALKPLGDLSRARAERAAAEAALVARRSEGRSLAARIDQAERALADNAAYVEGRCERPAQAPLPSRPPHAMPRAEAEAVAKRLFRDTMALRLGCDPLRKAYYDLGLGEDWELVERASRCDKQNRHPLMLATEDIFTPVVDDLQRSAHRCLDEDAKLKCLVAAGVIFLGRYAVEVGSITEALYGPYRDWSVDVARIKSAPILAETECLVDLPLVRAKDRLRAEAEDAVRAAGRAAEFARVDERAQEKRVEDHRDWRCAVPIERYNSVSGKIRRVN